MMRIIYIVPIIILVIITCEFFFWTLENSQKERNRPVPSLISIDIPLEPPQPTTQRSPSFVDLNSLKQDDPRLVAEIRRRFLIPPPPDEVPYALLDSSKKDPSLGQSQVIKKILNDLHGGFFIECGGLDGETISNTLFFERYRGWKGLLVEADPENLKQLISKQRHAWLSSACLSVKNHSMIVPFRTFQGSGPLEAGRGQIINKTVPRMPSDMNIQCVPLYSMLLALNQTTVDYFSLDVEGAELAILKTIPFDLVDIKTLSVEYLQGVANGAESGRNQIIQFMEQKGYILHSNVTYPGTLADDFIFVKKFTSYY